MTAASTFFLLRRGADDFIVHRVPQENLIGFGGFERCVIRPEELLGHRCVVDF
jgi:hypothetical protein